MPLRPLCAWDLGEDWIDVGTLARVRHVPPAHRHAPTPPAPHRKKAAKGHKARAIESANKRHAVEVLLLDLLVQQGVTDKTEQAMFLAQVAHESSGFTRLRENLSYSADRLMKVFPKKFTTVADATATAAGGADKVAERLYGGRRDLGNTHAGDGARYRGRGYIQLTGRNNYAAAGTDLKLDLVGKPEFAEEPATAARIAVWFWTRDSQLRQYGRDGNVEGATRRVNGGVIGLEDREHRFKAYLSSLAAPAAAKGSPLP